MDHRREVDEVLIDGIEVLSELLGVYEALVEDNFTQPIHDF